MSIALTKNPNRGTELGYAEITSSATSTNTVSPYDDVAGLSVTVTVGTRPILIRAWCSELRHSVAAGRSLILIKEGTTILAYGQVAASGTASRASNGIAEIRLNPSAGAHTYKVGLGGFDAGTMTVVAFATAPAHIHVTEV